MINILIYKDKILLLVFVLLLVTSCGGIGQNAKEAQNKKGSNRKPVAVISAPNSVQERSSVSLSALNSADPDNDTLTYEWFIDNDGLNVALNNANSVEASITVGELAEDSQLTLLLAVTDSNGATDITETELLLEEIDIDLLPPDPGDDGLATVEGIDSNNNLIRDDIEVRLLEIYPLNREMRQVMSFGSIAFQNAMVAGVNRDDIAADNAMQSISTWVGCMLEIEARDSLSSAATREEMSLLNSLVFNSQGRVAAKFQFDALRDGTGYRLRDVSLNDCVTQ